MKITYKDVWYYTQGNFRYKLYYSKLKFLIPLYLREQIEMRLATMNKECYNSGQCIECGCNTPALQMCNKSCDGDCYPPMVTKKEWNDIKLENYVE